MDAAIQSAIDDIEREHDVRVLYAAESGSRAWGFASPDSDYDVRFVYVHATDWYLQVFEQRDVIERMLPGDLDVSGWELRKALRLMTKCNLAFNEWFDSPIVYRADDAFAEQVRRLIARHFQPTRALFHYLSMARNTHDEHLIDDTVRLKKLFYFLRPILACRWIEHARRQPPTRFAELLAAPWVSGEERSWIAELEARKALASEGDREALPAALRPWMRRQLDHFAAVGPGLASMMDVDEAALDATLQRWIRG
jgi:predicted nucleotidyltransferase